MNVPPSFFGNQYKGNCDGIVFSLQVKAKLPYWLANPSVVSVDLKNLTVAVDEIPQLHRDLVAKLQQKGITKFFPGKSYELLLFFNVFKRNSLAFN